MTMDVFERDLRSVLAAAVPAAAPPTLRGSLADVVASGTAAADAARDFTVKVDAGNLKPGRTYFYAFDAGGEQSAIGRTKTLPAGGVDRLRLA